MGERQRALSPHPWPSSGVRWQADGNDLIGTVQIVFTGDLDGSEAECTVRFGLDSTEGPRIGKRGGESRSRIAGGCQPSWRPGCRLQPGLDQDLRLLAVSWARFGYWA
jgi:hypothetical protein